MTTSRAGSPERTGGPPALTASQVQRQTTSSRLLVAHPWIAHVALVALVLLLGAVTAVLAAETVRGATALGLFAPGSPVHDRVVRAWLAGAALGALVLLARHRWPLAVTAVLTVLAVLSLALGQVLGVLGLCLAWALHAVAVRRSGRTAWATGASVLVVVTVAVWWWQDIGLAEVLLWSDEIPLGDGPPAWPLTGPGFSSGRRSWTVMLLLALLVLGGVTGAGVRARRVHAHDLALRYAAMARERDTSAALARSAERARIAREMHDIVAHSVSVMVALSDGAASALDRAPEASRQALAELSRTGREALEDMRSVLGSLRPVEAGGVVEEGGPASPTAPTETDLHRVVERFRAAGLPVTTSGLQTPLPFDTALRLAVVRIVTEGLTNVLRHAPGTPSAGVALRCTDTAVEVEIVDAGGTRTGSDRGAHRGLVGMRERAALLGGHVEAGPGEAGGWRVRVVMPTGGADGGDRA
ncbi:sensor histidine kinase [Kineococcus radiotolerans]|uniref:histidine kinase n=1 Tax=Kineococcus radiotolerans (strain ATCC BAA-149 / DSM 14245 / SRS30216) TaxID=266940 RepID=A6W9H7_KINRD|nr:histidine kinase [Kineococcus radiotolerans]ABS03466.1 integral membrane sensor signal transduction histidine kinase [Kineococcus radiotolerans SRS30216 = ATCC BAA-149]